jgi:hypothetical protein
VGCEGFDPSLLQRSSEASRGGDSGPSEGPCPGAVEACNGRDDDCDGKSDEGAEASCRFANGEGACSAGTCLLAYCLEGYADCNRQMSDGCEARSNAPCRTTPISQGVAGAGPAAQPIPAGQESAGMSGESEEDAGVVCVPSEESCDTLDNDCDGAIDEGPSCALAMCASSTPSYRGAACDQCVCTSCTALVDLCQRHPDATWAMRCRELVECVVTESRAGNCGMNADCYMSGNGPCAAATNLAAGGADGMDRSQVATGCSGTPPPSACAAAVNYRDQCTRTTCMSACP